MKRTLVIIIALAAGVARANGPVQCKDVAKGDAAACAARVKAQCKQEKYWDRRSCEAEIATAADSCLNGQFETACKAARTLRAGCDAGWTSDATLKQLFDDAWVDKYNKAKDTAAAYAKFHQQWSACYDADLDRDACHADAGDNDECQKAPQLLRDKFTSEVDAMIEHSYTSREEAKYILALEAKLKPELRYKEKELQKIIDRADEADKRDEAARQKKIANSRCNPGKAASAAFVKLARSFYKGFEEDGDHKRTITSVRTQGGAERYVDRGSLITRESIPAEICSSYSEGGKKHCSAEPISFYREKAPGSPWSSWQIATSGTQEVSCK
jgi:hypothetical protein